MSTALQTTAQNGIATTQPGDLLSIIHQIASSPDASAKIEVMERMLAMQERVEAQRRKDNFDAAVARVQAIMPRIRQNGVIDMGQKGRIAFAKFEDVDAVARPLYAAEGFSVRWNAPISPDGRIRVVGKFSCGGHSEELEITLSPDVGPGRNAAQAVASAVAYGKRHLTKAFWNIIEEGQDVNGADPEAAQKITQDQADDIRSRLSEVKGNAAGFLRFMRVERFEDITVNQLPKANHAIDQKRAK